MENNKIYIGIIVTLTLTAAGVGGYFLWKKKKEESVGAGGNGAGAGSGGTTTAPATPSEATPSGGASFAVDTKTAEMLKEMEGRGIAPPKLTGAKSCSVAVSLAGDKTWEYRKCDTFWQTRKKGSTGQWISLANNKEAASKLDAAFPKI